MIVGKRQRWDVDWVLLVATLGLAVIGVAFIHSAEYDGGGFATRAVRQLAYLGLSVLVMATLIRFDYRRLARLAPWAFGAGILGLAAVLAVGSTAGGARSWIRVGGMSVQPSELAKVGTVLLVAWLVARQPPGRLRFHVLLLLVLVVAVPTALILAQPDTGTALTFFPFLALVVFVHGLRWRVIAVGVVVAALLTPVVWSQLKPYQQDRLRIVIDPELDPLDRGYHAIQSRIAVGSGGITGQGYTRGPQNRLGFLPERHTDFIFAVVAEEAGFLGVALVLGLYLVILRRLVEAAISARDRLGALLCLGAFAFVASHLVVNVGMVIGLLPTIGIPLPLLSFGGTSLLATCALIALAANVRLRRLIR